MVISQPENEEVEETTVGVVQKEVNSKKEVSVEVRKENKASPDVAITMT